MGREEGAGFRMGNTCISVKTEKINKKKKKEKKCFLLNFFLTYFYLAMLGLSCGTQDVLCVMWAQQLWCLGLVMPQHMDT